MSARHAWALAIRPRTLGASVVPVLAGLAVASRSRDLDVSLGLGTLAVALLIQIATNLANDVDDFRSGADAADRIGPTRVTQAGLLSPEAVRAAAIGCLALAAAGGVFLALAGGWPIVAIGAASIVCALAYTGGPIPLGYRGLGDPLVFVFFGPVAVVGTAYLQTGRASLEAAIASIPIGALATAILVVNNLRDLPTDRRAGKRTLAVTFGEGFARAEYAILVLLSFGVLAEIARRFGIASALPLLAIPLAVSEVRGVAGRSGPALNASLAGTARLHVVFGVLLAGGIAA